MKPNDKDLSALWHLAETGWLGERSAAFRQAIREEAHLQRFSLGEYTHHIGDGPGGIYGLVEGSFGVYTQSETEGVVLAHIFRAGAWFGQGPMALNGPRYLSFRAMEDAKIFTLSLSAIEHVNRAVPDAQREFMSLSEFNQRLMAKAMAELLIRKSDLRIAAVLLRILTSGQAIAGGRQMARGTVTQTELSEMANASRQTVNMVLKRFEASGWVSLGYGRIELSDPEALRAYVRG